MDLDEIEITVLDDGGRYEDDDLDHRYEYERLADREPVLTLRRVHSSLLHRFDTPSSYVA